MANKRTSSGQPNAAKASRRRSAPATEQVDANDQPEATELARAFGVDTNAVKGVRTKDQLFSLVDQHDHHDQRMITTNIDTIEQALIHRLQSMSGEIDISVVNRCIADAEAIKDVPNAIAVLRDMSQVAERRFIQMHGKVVVYRAFTGEEVCRVDRRPDSLFLGLQIYVELAHGLPRNAIYLNAAGAEITRYVKCGIIGTVEPPIAIQSIAVNASLRSVFIVRYEPSSVDVDLGMAFTEIMYLCNR